MGDTQTKKKVKIPKKPRIKSSAWHVVINANKKTGQFQGGEAELKRKLVMCANLLREPHLQRFVYIIPKGHSYEKNILVPPTLEFQLEKGKRGFYHVHAARKTLAALLAELVELQCKGINPLYQNLRKEKARRSGHAAPSAGLSQPSFCVKPCPPVWAK